MIKAIVVEDEWYNLEEIADLIESTGFIRVEKKYSNPLKVLEELPSISPQLAFIDIDMPEMDGIQLAEKLIQQDSKISIVFITAHNEHAVKAFDLNALDYIMKPINIKRFNNMIEKIKSKIDFSTDDKSKELKIKCFNTFETTMGGMPIKWERTKAKELFAYLLMNHDNYIHKDLIIEYLWPEYEPKKALPILQTSIYKIRKIFADFKKQLTLDYSNSKYCLVIRDVDCDYIEFEKAIDNYNIQDRNTYKAIENASMMFGRGFLTDEGYIWSIEKNETLGNRLAVILKEISEVYFNEKDHSNMLRILKMLVQIVPYEEEINYAIIKTMKGLGKYDEMLIHFKWLEKTLKDKYDITPSERIVSCLILDK